MIEFIAERESDGKGIDPLQSVLKLGRGTEGRFKGKGNKEADAHATLGLFAEKRAIVSQ